MKRENRKDDAISPVVGVMLMLVVTIVIAAVVVMFSTGLAGDTKTTPTALFEVSGMDTFTSQYGEELIYLNIRHKGGDVIPLSDLEITLENIGGFNSGLIQVYTASDSATSMDYTDAVWEEAGSSHQSIYAQATNGLKNTQEQYDSFLKHCNLPPTTTPTEAEEYYWDHIGEMDAIDPDFELTDLFSDRSNWEYQLTDIKNYFSGSELILDDEGNLLGGMRGFTDAYPMTVLGQTQPTKSTVSTGNIIHINPVTGSVNNVISAGSTVKWTISYIPTNSVIAKGEFEVIAD